MFGRAGVSGGRRRRLRDGRASAASPTSSTPSSAGRWAARPVAPPGPRPAPTSATTSGSRSRRPSLGTEKEIEFPVLGRCDTCQGTGAKPGTTPVDMPAVQRPRRDPVDPPDDARPDGQRQPLSALPGRGPDRRDAVRDVPRGGPRPSARARCGSRSRPASTRATRSGSRTRARSGRAAARRGASTSRSTWRAHPSLTREGTELFYEAELSIAQAALGTRIQRADGRGRGHRGRDQARDAARAPRSGSAAAACPTSAASRSAATST